MPAPNFANDQGLTINTITLAASAIAGAQGSRVGKKRRHSTVKPASTFVMLSGGEENISDNEEQ